MLLVLTFVACLDGRSAEYCRTVELPWEGSLMQCQFFGQMAAANWVRDHPGYAMSGRYRCLHGRAI